MDKNNTQYFEAGSPEWLRARLDYVTATEVASLFGLNPWKSANQVYKEKLFPKSIRNQFTRAGRILEPAVLKAFDEDLGLPVEPAHPYLTVFVGRSEWGLSATPDGKVFHEDKWKLVEAKTTKPEKFEAWFDAPPINYALQCHAQMLCCDMDEAFIGCLATEMPMPFVAWLIQKNEVINEILIKEAKRFWETAREVKNPEEFSFKVDVKLKKEIKALVEESQVFFGHSNI